MQPTTEDRFCPWLGFALEEALRVGVTDAAELLGFATPDVLVAQLPRELTTSLIVGALASGVLTPAAVLETAPPAVLAENLEADVLWRCLASAASRAHLDKRGASVSESAKGWLEAILERAISAGLIKAADVVRLVPPAEFVKDAPLAVVAELIKSGLMSGKFDPDLVLVHLTPHVIAHDLPPSLGWSCVVDGVQRQLGSDGPTQVAEVAAKEAPAPKRQVALPKTKPLGVDARIEPVLKRSASPKASAVEDWSEPLIDGNEVEVLDDQPLPPPPAVRQR